MEPKHYILISIFLLFFTPLIAQLKVEKFYNKNKEHPQEIFHIKSKSSNILSGPYQSYYYNGKTNTKGQYDNNEAVGLWQYFYENGKIKMEGNMSRNIPHGDWKYYYENGKISQKGNIFNDKKEGEWVYYFENGELKSRGNFKNNEKDGIWNYFYEDGKLKAQAVYKDGTGNYKEFYPSGKVKMEGQLKDGLSDSLWVHYYESSVKRAEGLHVEGEREGNWKLYHPNGVLSAEGNYIKGQKNGKWSYYHENGNLSSEGIEKEGYKDGYWKLFNKNGSLKGESHLVNGSGDYVEYYENKKIKIKGYIKNGQNSGKWLYYYEDGTLEGEAFFVNGEGEYLGFYKDGSIKMKGNINDGKNVGVWELYEKDGSLAGYYRPYYEDDKPVYRIVGSQTAENDSLSNYIKPEYKFRKRQIKYFVPRVNEFKGFIFSTNPIAPTLGSLPIAVEYYIQERLGHELQYTMIRDPFLKADKNISIGEIYQRGFSVALKQKFYHPDKNFGMFYFGHEIRYTAIAQMTNIGMNNSTTELNLRSISVDENKVEYSLLIGNRWIKIFGEKWIVEESKMGITIDIYGGIGIGYRFFNQGNSFVKSDYEAFNSLNMNDISIPLRFGVNIGLIF